MAVNRVLKYAAVVERRVAELHLAPEKLARMERALDLTWDQACTYQQRQARAFASGRLTYEEAQTVYAALNGETPRWADHVKYPLKVAITVLMLGLLTAEGGLFPGCTDAAEEKVAA